MIPMVSKNHQQLKWCMRITCVLHVQKHKTRVAKPCVYTRVKMHHTHALIHTKYLPQNHTFLQPVVP